MRERVTFAATLLTLSLLANPLLPTTRARAQTGQPQQQAQPQATPTPTPEPQDDADDGDVVRITTNLVQFDTVVTDRKGRQVTDLRPEDFEVTVNGRRQQITNFSYVVAQPTAEAAPPAEPAPRAADKTAPYVPPARVKPGDVRRTLALVVDDLGTSFEDIAYVRQALKKFVDEQMQPGDLVAVMRTSAGMGALQQFTSDKNVLRRAIERVRWNPMARAGVSAFAPIEPPAPSIGRQNMRGGGADGDDRRGDEAGRDADARQADDLREELFSVGTLGALNFIVNGMQELPGRKSIVMFSGGFEIINRRDPGENWRVIENLRRLVDLANRASVTVYTVDARGLPVLGLTAADNTSGRSAQQLFDSLNDRRSEYFDSQEGLSYLAAGTGGLFMHDTNDFTGAVGRVLDDQKGYYLIGFRPEESLFQLEHGRRRFNDLGVKVNRAGVRVRSRSGFLGVPDAEARPAPSTRIQQLARALASPFASGDVPLRLTSLLGGSHAKGAVVTSLMHIDMSNFKFTEEADGWHKAVIDLVAFTFGEQGNVIDHVNRTETVRVRGEIYEHVRRHGLVFQMQVPVKKPGAYQLRIAVRDAAAEKLGSASQFIEVPDLKKNRLALSGIVLQSTELTIANAAAAANPGVEQKETDPEGNAAVRRFRKGELVDYFYNIYNATLDKATGRPRLQTQMRIFRDQTEVYAGKPEEFDPGQQTDLSNLQSATRIRLNGLQPGEYVLQVVVTDALAPEKRRTVTQWIDFEVIR